MSDGKVAANVPPKDPEPFDSTTLNSNGVDEEKAEAESPSPEKEIPPEEGWAGWLCILGSFFSIMASFGFLNAIGVFQTYYEETVLKDYTPSDISWIFALQLSLMWLPGPFFGRLVDSYGPRFVLIPSSIACVFSLCMTSLSTKYYQFILAQGLIYGLGAGGIFTTSFVCSGQWFVRRRGLAIGVAAAGSSFGGVIFPLLLNKVLGEVGFAGMVRYCALFVGILLASSCLLITARLPRKKWNPKLNWIDFSLFKDPAFASYTVGAYLVMWGLWSPFDFLPTMAESQGMSASLSLYLISIINAGSLPGRIIPAHFADKLGFFNVMTFVSFLTGVSILCLWLPFDYHPSHAGLMVFGVVYGFVSGAYVSLLMPCAAKSGSLETLGQRFGTFQSVIGIASLTGLPIMGAILETKSGFMGMQVFSIVSILVGTGAMGVARYILGKSSQTFRV
ncbi:hypothetical protein JMJ35_006658 [Cladonia borealis]|uniref:Major facilitator superfamily (MFS) profile domain-containing protein n=1 Tax=Cladonia borealis TaxID=184061 RepID=A0AA39U979_9LECA|nr:hypothetical protein JMJ35_006658 [Cladonia borealis]